MKIVARNPWQRIGTVVFGLALAGTLAAGCSDSSTDVPADGVEGTYTLSTVNGIPVPATIFEIEIDGVTFTEIVASGQIQLAGGTYSGSLSVESRENGVVVESETDTFTGNYTVTGNTVTLEDEEGDEDIVATLTSTTLTVLLEDSGVTFTLIFVK